MIIFYSLRRVITMSTKTTAQATKKEFTMRQVFAMWKRTSKNGNSYFTGKGIDGAEIRGFYNTKKANPKEPDIRIYKVLSDGSLEKEQYLGLWCNAKENGKKYLSGKLDGLRVVGFINSKATDENKQPYFSVYWSDTDDKKPVEEKKATKKETKKIEEDEQIELPF